MLSTQRSAKVSFVWHTSNEDPLAGKYLTAVSSAFSDSNPEQAQKTLAKVLFGMVVRERRRISALARTASSLDDKLQQKERAAEESEANLRAYRNEQRQLEQRQLAGQQKSILSQHI